MASLDMAGTVIVEDISAVDTRVHLSQERIVDAAQKLIDETGSMEWSVRAICRTLDCAPGALYRHFPDGVSAIAENLRRRHVARLEECLGAAEEDEQTEGLASLIASSWAARFTRSTRAYLRFAADNQGIYRHLFGHNCAAHAVHETKDAAAGESLPVSMQNRYTTIIRKAARARELIRPVVSEDEAQTMATLMWLQLHGFADLKITGMLNGEADSLEDGLIVSMLQQVGFNVAANPVGLEAAAKLAKRQSLGLRPTF